MDLGCAVGDAWEYWRMFDIQWILGCAVSDAWDGTGEYQSRRCLGSTGECLISNGFRLRCRGAWEVLAIRGNRGYPGSCAPKALPMSRRARWDERGSLLSEWLLRGP
jgi:hypothetical protein